MDNGLVYTEDVGLQKISIKELKKHAQSDIKWGKLFIATAIVVTITLILVVIANLPSVFITQYTIMSLLINILLLLAISFPIAGMTVGLNKMFLEVRRKEATSTPFSSMSRVLPMWIGNLLVSLIVYLLILPGIIVSIGGVVYKSQIITLVGLALFVALGAIAIILSLKFAMTPYFIADGNKAIEAMKKSSQLTKGRKAQLFGLRLSFIGWYLLAMLFAILVGTVVGALPTFFMGEVSKIGVVLANLNLILIITVSMLPLTVYMTMADVEYYDFYLNYPLNEITDNPHKIAILIPLIASFTLAVFSAISLALPIMRTPLPATVNVGNIAFLADKGMLGITTISDNVEESASITLNNMTAKYAFENTSWKHQDSDVQMYLGEENKSGGFNWYLDDSTYMKGQYKLIQGKDTLDYIPDSLGITQDELAVMNSNNMIAIVVTPEETLDKGENISNKTATQITYIGNVIDADSLVLINAQNGSIYTMIKTNSFETKMPSEEEIQDNQSTQNPILDNNEEFQQNTQELNAMLDESLKEIEKSEKLRQEYEQAREAAKEPSTATFHDITYTVSGNSVSRDVSDEQRNIAIDGAMIQMMYSAGNVTMSDGAKTATNYVRKLGGSITNATEITNNGILMGCATYTLNGNSYKLYIFTLKGNMYAITSANATTLDTLMASVK